MKLLWCSDAYWSGSGYGVQARSILPRLAQLPEINGISNLALFAWFGLQGAVLELNGLRIYPHSGSEYGQDVIGLHAKHFGADVVVTLVDVWTQTGTGSLVKPAQWVPWLPVDSDPVPPRTLDALQEAHSPLVYSVWGQRQLAAAGVNARYVPLGIEPDVFKPMEFGPRRAKLREQLVGPGCEHLTVMVAANVAGGDRKAFQQQLRAWSLFAVDKPGARLYVHADPLAHYGGLDLRALAANLGIGERVRFADSYQYFLGYSREYVAGVYQAADVLLAASMAEGFGLPIVEAQACGLPVVVTQFASMPELVKWGWQVAPLDRYWVAGLGAWWAWPDVKGIADALEALWTEQREQGPEKWAGQARFASESMQRLYGWDTIVQEYWKPLIAELAGL